MGSIDGLFDPKVVEENNILREYEKGRGAETSSTAHNGQSISQRFVSVQQPERAKHKYVDPGFNSPKTIAYANSSLSPEKGEKENLRAVVDSDPVRENHGG